ncbi:hypothetical protein HDV03_000719 [Kappamyces sp. JEL0829]|nr:hypothetical protein HDV03_000719 [Kappamyces sp. JEL0829]
MKFAVPALVLALTAVCAPTPSVVKDIGDSVFPVLQTSLNDAVAKSIQEVKAEIERDTKDFIAKELHGIPLVPQAIEDKINAFLMDRIINPLADKVATNALAKVQPKVTQLLGYAHAGVNKMDADLDKELAEFSASIRHNLGLP